MNESLENNVPNELHARFKEFDGLHNDNWSQIVKLGVPLYKDLMEAGDPRAEIVRNTLSSTLAVIKNSGAGGPEKRNELVQAIEQALQE